MLKKILFLVLTFILAKCNGNCDNESIECLEKKLISYVDDLEKNPTVSDYLVIEKIKGLQSKNCSSEDIVGRTLRFLKENEIKLKIPDTETGRSLTGNFAFTFTKCYHMCTCDCNFIHNDNSDERD